MTIKILQLCYASVVEIGICREVLYRVGFSQRREGDYLLVFPREQGTSFYSKPETDYDKKKSASEPVARFYVDEGIDTDTMNPESQVTGRPSYNAGWEEFVDATTLCRLVALSLAPDTVYEDTGMMGRGSRTRHFQAQYGKVLLTHREQLRKWGFDAPDDVEAGNRVPDPIIPTDL